MRWKCFSHASHTNLKLYIIIAGFLWVRYLVVCDRRLSFVSPVESSAKKSGQSGRAEGEDKTCHFQSFNHADSICRPIPVVTVFRFMTVSDSQLLDLGMASTR
jgi:hypothetical protein